MMSQIARQLGLFLFLAFFCATTSIFLLPTKGASEAYPILLSYPFLCTLLICFAFSIFEDWGLTFKSLNENKFILVCVSLVALWLCSAEPYMFKIVNDEGLIASTAQSFHLERAAAVSKLANWSTGHFETYEGFLDKRSLLLPFLVSIIHDLSGYRLGNVFFLNGLFLFGLLLLVAVYLRRVCDDSATFLSLTLLGFLPVLAQGATSGNASVLNVMLLMACFVLGMRYWNQPDEKTLPPIVYCLILLANTRYESILYILPFGVLILLGWKKANRVILSPLVVVAPLFLVFTTWHLRYALTYEAFYMQSGPDARDASFSFAYVLTNIQETLSFLFSFGSKYPNSPILSICGFSGMAVVLFHSVKKNLKAEIQTAAFLLVALAATNLTVILCFSFGLFTNYVTARLSLPLYLILCLFAALGFHQDKRLLFRISVITAAVALGANSLFGHPNVDETIVIRVSIGFIVLAGGYVLLACQAHRLKQLLPLALLILSFFVLAPKMRNHTYLDAYGPAIAVEKLLGFVEENNSRDALFVAHDTMYPILLRANTISPQSLPKAELLAESVTSGHYNKIYYIDSIAPDKSQLPEFPVPEGFELVPLIKERLAPGYFFEVSELRLLPPTDHKSTPTETTEPHPASLPATQPKTISMTTAGSEAELETGIH